MRPTGGGALVPNRFIAVMHNAATCPFVARSPPLVSVRGSLDEAIC